MSSLLSRRRRPAPVNTYSEVVTSYPGDPMGEALAGPLAANIAHQLAGGSGTIVPATASASAGGQFTGSTRGGLAVPMASNPRQTRSAGAGQFHNDVSTEMDPYRAMLAERLARRYR